MHLLLSSKREREKTKSTLIVRTAVVALDPHLSLTAFKPVRTSSQILTSSRAETNMFILADNRQLAHLVIES